MKIMKNRFILFTFIISIFSSCENKNTLVLNINKDYSTQNTTCYNLLSPSGQKFLITFDSLGNLDMVRNDLSTNYQTIYYNSNKQLHSIVKYINNKPDGRTYFFYENSGFLEGDFNYKGDIKTGNAVLYYDSSVMLKETMLYNDYGELYHRIKYDRTGKVIRKEGSDGSE